MGEDAWLGECTGVRGDPIKPWGGGVEERGERLGDRLVGVEGIEIDSSTRGGGRGDGGGDVSKLAI